MSETEAASQPGAIPPEEEDALVDTNLDEDDRLRPEFVSAVLSAVEEGKDDAAQALVETLHPADIADLLELTPEDRRAGLVHALGSLVGAEVLSELNDYVRDTVVEALELEQLAELAGELDTDDAVAIIEDLNEEDQQTVLDAMEPEDRAAIESALGYPEESAGRLMQRDLVAVPEHWTVGQTIDFLRDTRDLTSDFWEIFVVDAAHRPIGSCQLSWVLRCPREIAMSDVMKREQTLIPVDMDQEEVALRFQKYALISAAVVDPGGRLVGMITVDDVVHIIQEEAGEDILRLSGAGEGDINEPVRESYKARVRWLLANLITALFATAIIAAFEDAIAKMVVLAVLMPIVASVGGNAGSQTMAVTVRALATNQITASNTWRMIMRELRVAVLNGATVAVVLGIGVGLFFQDPLLGGVIGSAMVLNIVTAGFAGVAVPILFERFNVDPAVASSIFVTTVTDSMGFLSFLGLATLAGLTS
ncbi:magnesium transporter [Sphingobium sp. B2D3A]|uniref:magnesium transporter n=1 Tax=Sphingobium TaxID=165695 RepID=UPI0015ECBE2D|nr:MULTISPECIES: magnesium transporter [Sphingobium]MCW2335806.1 magnesium transporter [Sphingobium sp. B2D3A]MCW2349478.1 magnesium transporter [Sphingobium sp. B12D2B]MCW2364118.1 magnesium transporter [Sphingobium sp. B10D3B]MCW2367370.1 magnesium transporter [Sphingobium sp. B7D2B]MCW2368581.1 magnesium transporter [Sphingobium sp. B11D3D]